MQCHIHNNFKLNHLYNIASLKCKSHSYIAKLFKAVTFIHDLSSCRICERIYELSVYQFVLKFDIRACKWNKVINYWHSCSHCLVFFTKEQIQQTQQLHLLQFCPFVNTLYCFDETLLKFSFYISHIGTVSYVHHIYVMLSRVNSWNGLTWNNLSESII